jgi:glycogen debranching enzyme
MAEDLLKQGLTAGDIYNEVWIRDLNTFVEASCHIGESEKIKNALLTFFKFQGKDGNIPDGYTPLEKTGNVGYNFIFSEYAPELAAHKNTVETDQESSLIQAVYKYVKTTGDNSILDEEIGGRTIDKRIDDAMRYLLKDRYAEEYGLLWGATTSDWGDVQPEHEWGVELDSTSHKTIDIYDNAMFIIAIKNYISMTRGKDNAGFWDSELKKLETNVRKHLWDSNKKKFIPHIYLEGTPFPEDFDENEIYYHGGTTIAIEAGLLSKEEIKEAYAKMQQNVKDANAQTIGLTLYPAYPNGYFKNPIMSEYSYQNGGDWTWFGGRTVQQLIENGMYEEAYESISPMLDRVIKHNGFYEWWTPTGTPHGAGNFKGAAGVLWKSIQMFKECKPGNNKSTKEISK